MKHALTIFEWPLIMIDVLKDSNVDNFGFKILRAVICM